VRCSSADERLEGEMSNRGLDEHGFLIPQVDEESVPFWEGTARGELLVQRCDSCATLRFPPRPMCHVCQSTARSWAPMAGTGTIWSFVVPHPPLLEAYAALAPYNVILVELDEDPILRLVGNLVASPDGSIGEVDPTTIGIGERVRAVFPEGPGGYHLPRWLRID